MERYINTENRQKNKIVGRILDNLFFLRLSIKRGSQIKIPNGLVRVSRDAMAKDKDK